jgi:type I restriction enzyme S subunit
MSDLSNGWCETLIADVIEPFSLADPTKTPEKIFKYVDIGSIDNNSQTIASPKVIQGANAPSRARRVINTGDTLFSTVRTYLRNIALVPEELDGQLTSTGIAVLRPSKAIHPKYLFKWVSSDQFVDNVSVAQDGTMYPAVSDRDVFDAIILVPPLPEQHRIVTQIDRLSAKSKRARDPGERGDIAARCRTRSQCSRRSERQGGALVAGRGEQHSQELDGGRPPFGLITRR